MKPWAWILIGFMAGIALFSYLLPNREQSFPNWDPQIIVQLTESGYTPLETQKPPSKPVSIPGVSSTLYGSGIAVRPDSVPAWPDTLPVVVSVVEYAGQPWIGAWVNGVPVSWTEAPRLRLQSRPRPSPVSAIAEYAILPGGGSWGVGASWQPLRLASLHAGPALTVHTGAEWAAASVRVSHRFGPASVGASVGYRLGLEQGLHAGVSAGLAIDL